MSFVPPLSTVLSGVLAIDRIWDVFVELGKRGNAQMVGPFDETRSVAPHPVEQSSSTYLTMLLQQFHTLWDLGFYFSSNESILIDEIPVFYDVSRIVSVSGMTEIDQNSAVAAIQQLFPPSVAVLNQTFRLPRFFHVQPFAGVSWQIFAGVSPLDPAVLTCETLGIDELLGEFSFTEMPKTAGMEKDPRETPAAVGVSAGVEPDLRPETPSDEGVSPRMREELRVETAVEPNEFDGEFHSEIPAKDEEKEFETEIEFEIENPHEIDTKSTTETVETVETIDTHSESAVLLSPKDEPPNETAFSETGFSKEFHSVPSPGVSLEPDFESVGSHTPFSSQVNALFQQDFRAASSVPRGYSSPWRRSQDTFDALYGSEEPRGWEDAEEMEEERRSVSLRSLLSEVPGKEGTLRRRGRLLYHGDEDEDVRNAVCMEAVAAAVRQIVGLLGKEGKEEAAGELRESMMGMGKQGEKSTVMEMIPEESAGGEAGGEEEGGLWNTGCGKDSLGVCWRNETFGRVWGEEEEEEKKHGAEEAEWYIP